MFVGQVVSERHSKADKMGDWGERITMEEVLKLVPLQGKDQSQTSLQQNDFVIVRRLGGQQTNHQFFHQFSEVSCLVINFQHSKEKFQIF